MNSFLEFLAANTLVSGCLALVAALVWRCTRHAPIAHALMLLALLKLITPPLFDVDLPVPGFGSAATPSTSSVVRSPDSGRLARTVPHTRHIEHYAKTVRRS